VLQQLHQHTFANGLTLIGERMDHVRSATFYAMIPAGYTHEPEAQRGLAGIVAELLSRGAGSRTSMELALELDNLGADRGESPGLFNLTCYAGTLARNLPQVLELYADVLLRAHLPEDEVDPARELALQELQSLDDSPSEMVMLELKRRNYPAPINRNSYGTPESLAAITPASVKNYYSEHFRPQGAIISVAGNIDFPALVEQIGTLFGEWSGVAPAASALVSATRESGHIHKETQQVQIALAFPSAPFDSPDFYQARGAIGILSGGMSARLFTEVREKRGLCYSVSASYDSVKDHASVVCHAGTSVDRAQETLDVTMQELRKLKEGIAQDEVDRVKASLKTSLIMQQESTSSRAGSMASDWFHLGRSGTIDEIQTAIDALTPKSILEYLERYPVRDVIAVTIGPKPLVIPE